MRDEKELSEEEYKTCFAYEENRCRALIEMLCVEQGKCPFFKTKEEFEKNYDQR